MSTEERNTSRRGELLTAGDVAKQLSVSQSTVRMWVSQGTIPFIRLGKLVRFQSGDIERWMEEHAGRSA